MGEQSGGNRTLAVCVDCGTAYAAHRIADGTVLPIGQRDGCSCGGTVFREVDPDPPFADDGVSAED